jgi:hypothetical protein
MFQHNGLNVGNDEPELGQEKIVLPLTADIAPVLPC